MEGIIHMVLLVFLEKLAVLWSISAGILILAVICTKKRSWKNFFYIVMISALLPLIVGLVILWLPFAILKKKDKKVIKRILHHPDEGEEGHPATIIKKYLTVTRHEK